MCYTMSADITKGFILLTKKKVGRTANWAWIWARNIKGIVNGWVGEKEGSFKVGWEIKMKTNICCWRLEFYKCFSPKIAIPL